MIDGADRQAADRRREARVRYRISLPTLLSLFGGRIAFRVSLLLTNAVLLARWGADYAPLAAALGTSAFLISLSSLGLEQAALRLAPRRLDLARTFVSGVLLLSAGLAVAGLLVVLGRGLASSDELVIAAGVHSVLLGQNQVLAGASRALARNAGDALNHGLLSALVIGLLVVTLLLDLRPSTYLWSLAAVVLVADLLLLMSLRDALRHRPPRDLLARCFSTAARMAVGDVVPGLAISLVYVALIWSGRGEESSALYLTLTASALALGAFGYLLRIYQPQVVLSLDDGAVPDLDRRVRQSSRRLVAVGLPFLVATTGATWLLVRDASLAVQGLGALALFVLNAPIFVVMASIDYVMENAEERDLNTTAAASLVSLVPTAALAVVVIPAFGVIGAVATLVALELAHAQALLIGLSRFRRPTPHHQRA